MYTTLQADLQQQLQEIKAAGLYKNERIILTPQHAKRLLLALKDNVQKYEMQFGKIDDQEPPFPAMNFGPPTAQA